MIDTGRLESTEGQLDVVLNAEVEQSLESLEAALRRFKHNLEQENVIAAIKRHSRILPAKNPSRKSN